MRLSRILLPVLFAIVGCFASVAQNYHGALLWDATGDVKEIKYKTENPVMPQKKIKFDKDGKISRSMIVYNNDGLPYGMDMNFGPMKSVIRFAFTPDSLLQKVEIEANVGRTGNMTSLFEYDGKTMTGQKVEGRSEDNTEKGKELEYVFSGYEYDSKGNWTGRDVKLKMTDCKKNETTEKEYRETRQITYWSDQKK